MYTEGLSYHYGGHGSVDCLGAVVVLTLVTLIAAFFVFLIGCQLRDVRLL